MCFLASVFITSASAQVPAAGKPYSNLRTKLIPAGVDTVRLDTLSVIPQTVRVIQVPDSFYTIDFINALLVWNKRWATDSVLISYRVFSSKQSEWFFY